MGSTIAEKILSGHAGRAVRAGEIAVCDVDYCFGQDGTSGLIIDRYRDLNVSQPFDKARFSMVIDHSAPSPTIGVSAVHAKMRSFARETGVRLYEGGCGVCHQVIPESGAITCGDLVLGADSHTCTSGALNIFATGVGSTDLAVTLATGKNWFRVPETIQIVVKGALPAGVYAKDLMLHIARHMGANGAAYKALEFHGEAIAALSLDGRFTLANMAVEVGAKTGLMAADKKVLQWLGRFSKREPHPVEPDPDASYAGRMTFDVSRLIPQVARPHAVDNAVTVEELEPTPIDVAFIGTCTNGRLEDLAVAARILKGARVHPCVKCIVAPASRGIYLQAVKAGLVDIFVGAGCAVVTPGCGPCVGTHNGVLADGEVAISTANRNFKGRMGNPNASIYLASPATAAASAIAGSITDPRAYAKRLRGL